MTTIRDDKMRRLDVYGYREEVKFVSVAPARNDERVNVFLDHDNADLAALAEELSKLDGFEATYTPPIPEVYLPKGIGAVIGSEVYRYVRTGEDQWQSIRYASTFTDEEMRACRKGKPYTIISEGVEL